MRLLIMKKLHLTVGQISLIGGGFEKKTGNVAFIKRYIAA